MIEQFLDSLGLDLNDFAYKMTGGWLFGYVLALQRQDWRPIIVCPSERVGAPMRLIHAGTGAPVWAVPARRSNRLAGQSLHCVEQWLRSPRRDFATVLSQERCVAIIAQEYEYFRFDTLARLGRRRRIPVYATFQGADATRSAIERLVRPRSLGLCSGLIVASARERARIAGTYACLKAPVAGIPNPLDCDEWRPLDRAQARAELGLPLEAFIVINHGRTDIGRKGLDVLVEAWKQFAVGRTDAHAYLIGSGQDHADFAQLIRDRAPERLTWISSYITDRPQMRQWLSAADAYLITSRTEGMPVAPLEAMACGLPVVSSDAHGLPDIFAAGEEHGGIVTAREDVNAVVAALERLAVDPSLRSRLGRAARRRVEEHFSIPAVGAALSGFLRENASAR
ncbi:MAG TPA: glycosyltransferase family 4 protein [Dongiaceae bacterium]|nr:glycosyltransferase family 4 protein [Dongiaceae bacterium]